MPKRIKIPYYAKVSAKKGLSNRKNNIVHFTSKESRDLGIYSGEAIAKKLTTNKYIDEKDLRKIAKFYKKYKNERNKKTEEALLLWGGRRFCKLMYDIY